MIYPLNETKNPMNTIHRLAISVTILFGCATCVQAQEESTGNRLEDVTRDMKVASDHLAKKVTEKPTQSAQESAVSKLEALIAELEEKKSRMGNGANARPTKPAEESSVRNGPGGMGDLHGTRMQGDRWGELPAHERDRILQSLTEGFPPHYQAVLEAYYKRLAVEKKADGADAAVEPKPAAAPKANMKPEMKIGSPKAVTMSTEMSKPAKKTDK